MRIIFLSLHLYFGFLLIDFVWFVPLSILLVNFVLEHLFNPV
jgi:hypothetical protein